MSNAVIWHKSETHIYFVQCRKVVPSRWMDEQSKTQNAIRNDTLVNHMSIFLAWKRFTRTHFARSIDENQKNIRHSWEKKIHKKKKLPRILLSVELKWGWFVDLLAKAYLHSYDFSHKSFTEDINLVWLIIIFPKIDKFFQQNSNKSKFF